jgi:uncharacterized protein (TIRG00374 family)
MKKRQLAIGALISAICLYFAFKGISFRDVGLALSQAKIKWLFAALAIYACGFIFRAIRWRVLMAPIKGTTAQSLIGPMIIGFFANNVLPFRMGEVARAIVTGHKFKISKTTALGTIVIERICDTLTFLSMFLTVALFFPFPNEIKKGAYALGGTCIGLIAVLILVSKNQHLAHRIIDQMPVSPTLKKKIQHLILNFAHGISGMTNGPYVIKAMLLSILVWLIEGTNVYFITRAFPVHVSYPQAYFILFFLGLSVTLPQAPGYVGTVELFGVMALSLLNVPKELGLPIVLTIHGLSFCFISFVGFLALWQEGLSIGNLFNRSELSEETDEPQLQKSR